MRQARNEANKGCVDEFTAVGTKGSILCEPMGNRVGNNSELAHPRREGEGVLTHRLPSLTGWGKLLRS